MFLQRRPSAVYQLIFWSVNSSNYCILLHLNISNDIFTEFFSLMNFVASVVRQSRSRLNKLYYSVSNRINKVHFLGNTMPEKSVIQIAIEERHEKAVGLVAYLKKEIELLELVAKEQNISDEHKKLLEENKKLKEELQYWQTRVIDLEKQHGIQQIAIPENAKKLKSDHQQLSSVNPFDVEPSTIEVMTSETKESKALENEKKEKKEVSSKKKEKDTSSKKKEKTKADANDKDDAADIHVGRLDLRIGRIISVEKHPDADSLYVEQIDLGEENPRTVISGLVKYVTIEEMKDRLVVVLCNLKPVKMRGILSEGMVMCASTPEKVEILNPPSNAIPGDIVTCDNFPGKPDALLNPKKKIFEQVAPDLKTNDEFFATYKSFVLKVGDKGVVKANSLANVPIK